MPATLASALLLSKKKDDAQNAGTFFVHFLYVFAAFSMNNARDRWKGAHTKILHSHADIGSIVDT